jgi:hypothetical protein
VNVSLFVYGSCHKSSMRGPIGTELVRVDPVACLQAEHAVKAHQWAAMKKAHQWAAMKKAHQWAAMQKAHPNRGDAEGPKDARPLPTEAITEHHSLQHLSGSHGLGRFRCTIRTIPAPQVLERLTRLLQPLRRAVAPTMVTFAGGYGPPREAPADLIRTECTVRSR